MARVHVFADEAGNFDFSRKAGASRFFILTTVAFPAGHDALATSVRALRFELAWEGIDLRRGFHATDDTVYVRDRVFEVLRQHDFRVDAMILEKPRARPALRRSEERFYRTAWAFHLRNILPDLLPEGAELHVVAASVGTGRRRREFLRGLERAVQDSTTESSRVDFWPAATEAGLQVADYCAWAIQRKWERNDLRHYAVVQDAIGWEHDLFREGGGAFY